MVLHERVILIMVTMSRPGNYDLRLNVFFCGMTLPVCLHIIFFDLSAAKNLKVVNTASLGPLMALGKLLATSVHPFDTDKE